MTPPNESLDAISARLRLLREALYPSQAELCRSLGIATTAWNNYEVSHKRIGLDTALLLRRRTGATLDWIYAGDESGLPKRVADAIDRVRTGQPRSARNPAQA